MEEINGLMPEGNVEYTEDNIRHLDDMEHIRVRSGMYIGRLGDGTQNRLPQKSTTMKLTRMVFAKLHVPSTPMWPQCMAGKLYRTTSFR